MNAAVRHNEAVLGMLAVFRADTDAPYEAGDDTPVPVLADRVGFAIDDAPAGRSANHEQAVNGWSKVA